MSVRKPITKIPELAEQFHPTLNFPKTSALVGLGYSYVFASIHWTYSLIWMVWLRSSISCNTILWSL